MHVVLRVELWMIAQVGHMLFIKWQFIFAGGSVSGAGVKGCILHHSKQLLADQNRVLRVKEFLLAERRTHLKLSLFV